MVPLVFTCVVTASGTFASAAAPTQDDPPYSVDEADLAAGLDCPDTFGQTGPDDEVLLLVHGTFTAGHEQYDWNYGVYLPDRGIDFCIVTYPDRGFGDMQESAEYVVWAINEIHARSGRPVDVVGHSQGGLLPRWAATFWPSVREATDDMILIAGPHHGTSAGGFDADQNPAGMPPVFWQFNAQSNFFRALNAGDETPGDIDWTQIYTLQDELVQPSAPVPTAALDFGVDNAKVTNVLIQDVCPARVVDHLTIGTTDLLAFDMVVAAATNDGPLDVAAMGLGPGCNVALNLVGDPAQLPAQFAAFETAFAQSQQIGFGTPGLVGEEPPLKAYADPDAQTEPDPAPTTESPAPNPSSSTPDSTGDPSSELPATGGGLAVAALGVLSAGALRRRR